MREVALVHTSSFDIEQANAVVLRRPVDSDEPLHIVDHVETSLAYERATAILIDPCTGALGATSYWISIAAAPPGRGSYGGARGTGGQGGSRQIGPCCQSTPLDRRRTQEGYRVGKAKRAHHPSTSPRVNGGHAALYPPTKLADSRFDHLRIHELAEGTKDVRPPPGIFTGAIRKPKSSPSNHNPII